MRRIWIIIGIIAGIVAAALVFAATFNVNRYHHTIQSQLQQRLGRPVTLGEMRLRLFPLRLNARDLAIADDPSFNPDAPFLKAQQLDVSLKLLPLLNKELEINSLALQRPNIKLIKNEAGTWNVASLGHPEAVQGGRTQAPKQPAAEEFHLSELAIRDGQISVLDKQTSKTPSLYDHIDVTLIDFAPGTAFTLDAAAHMPGAGSEQIRLQGKGGPVVRGQPAATPFDGMLGLKQVEIADLSKFLNLPALRGIAGTLTGQTRINSASGRLTAQGEADVQNARVNGMELGYPIRAQYDLMNDVQTSLITLRSVILKLGATPFSISGYVNTRPTPAQLDVKVMAANVSVAELARLAAASGMALSQGTNATGNVNLTLQAQGAADKPALNGTITASNIEMSGREIAQPVHIQSISLHLTPAQIQSDPFLITSGGTTMNAQFAVRDYVSPTATMNATVRAPNAQLPAVLAMAKAYGVQGLDKVSGAGVMNLDMHVTGLVKSITETEMIKALNGTINLHLTNVKYSGANIVQELGSIGGFLDGASTAQTAQGVTDISKLTGDIAVKNGIAQTNNVEAQLEVGSIGLAGTASLLDQTLNMRATAVLSQSFSQKAGGTSVSGFMNTALANKQGQLVVPCLVTGTFSNPKFTPDVQQVAQMKLRGLMPDINNPSSSVSALYKLLGKGTAQEQQQTPEQKHSQEQQEPNAAQQILDMLQKKKPPK